MTLLIGHRFGRYEITAALGAGGMGEVYRASDARLKRDIAVKILPASLARDPDRLTRFEREAQILAALNHPHIAAIYGIEEWDGVRALLLELVEGPTLADRLRAGALPLREGLAIARQLAEALDAAHERGIIHRDLKPANIKLTPAGAVKVLDFGIAKVRAPEGAADVSTVSVTGTQPGTVLGTPAYMSPEQARGQAVDKRTDIWAFGCVLYEMLTGRAAFAGNTTSETLARVLEREPDWTRLDAATPSGVRRLLRRCLEKDSKKRLRDIGDARLELQEPTDGGLEPTAISQSRPGTRVRWIAATGAATLVLGFLGGVVWQSITRPVVRRPDVVQFAVPLSAEEIFPLEGPSPPSLAISPDGKQIAYLARGPAGDRVFLRRLSDSVAVPLAGTEGAIGPFFSPDGQWIGFASGGTLKKVPVAGGAPQDIAGAISLAGATWMPDDTIVFSPEWRDALFRVSASGGEPRALTTLNREANELEHIAPHVLPDGTHLLMTVGTGSGLAKGIAGQHIEVVDLVTGQRRRLIEGRNPVYVAAGHIVFARGDALFAVPLDSRLELTGPPVRILEGVRSTDNDTQFALSRNGTLAYIPSGGAGGDRRLVRVDRERRTRPFADYRGSFVHPRISPDGRHVVVQERGDFWICDVERGTRTRLRAQGTRPIWMPDGRSILFHGQGRLYQAPIDDSTQPRLVLTPEHGLAFPLAWSRDGRALIYSNPVPGAGRSRDVWILPAGGKPMPFLTTPRDERSAMFSPDGRWVVYAEKDVGREEEVYVQPYAGPGDRVIVSRGGGLEPVWSPTGQEIFYRSVNGRRMMAVAVHTEPSLSVGPPRVLFEGPYPIGWSHYSDYDVFPGGNEFLMVAADDATPSELRVVINWAAEITQRLAARQ